jgi:uncharacterized protein YjbJ (UPF0337 family)
MGHRLISINGRRQWSRYVMRASNEARNRCRLAELNEEKVMDTDRIAGSAKEVKGTVKEAVGKVVGDAKLESEGKADKAEGKMQNAIGGLKDVVRDAVNK